MDKRYIFIIPFVLIIITIIYLFYKSKGAQKTFKAEVQKSLKRTSTFEKRVLTENDIKRLPQIVQKYLKYVGVIGKEKIYNLRTVTEINMNLGSDKGWTIMTAEEYNFFDDSPGRLVLMKFKMRGLPVVGLDSYIGGKGRMLMKPLGLFAVVDAKGHEMDDSSAVAMLLLNMCTAAPATLIDNRLQWSSISPTSVKATFNNSGCIVSGVLDFKENGELINFSTEDKYYSPSGDSYEQVRWSTPVKDYKDINGLKLATYGEAIWHFPKGDNCYGKLILKKIEYNCESVR
ncbi:MAG: hypothetical protein K0R21_1725 [Anaerocolumna sp.]|jgi:hypothetical protein|nr:hypothetical protein [Anaerocolumna sp.]